jgi:hypothetical protein
MRIYVSGTFTAQHRLRDRANQLFILGHEITSTWLNESAKPAALTEEQWLQRLATKDVAEVMLADCLVLDLAGVSTTGGRFVEWGVASHPRDPKLRYTVGPRDAGCFHRLADAHFATWEDLLAHFEVAHAVR